MGKFTYFFTATKKKLLFYIDTYPFALFIGLLATLLVLIIIGHQLRTPAQVSQTEQHAPTPVTIFAQGETPAIEVTAKIEKSGVITILAQTNGIVQKIPVSEGMQVKRGTKLAILASNYQGANAAAISRQLAQRSAQFNADTYQLKKDSIMQKREEAQRQESDANTQRSITAASVQDTRDLIKLNEEIVSGLNKQIADLESINQNGASNSAILQIKQSKALVVNGLNQLKAGLRSGEYTSSNDNDPAQLKRITKELTLKQLDIEEKNIDLSRDLANLQVKIQWITESLMYPTTPCPGIVDRVLVKVGQMVNPGTPLAIIRADAREITAVVSVPGDIASRVSRAEQSTFTVDDQTFAMAPRYISAEPTDGTLHTILYSIPGEYERYFSNNEQVSVRVPLGTTVASTIDTFIPLDAVYQTQEAAFVYVAVETEGRTIARVQQVELGAVSGGYVKVVSGLSDTAKVIITRGMSDGELIAIQ